LPKAVTSDNLAYVIYTSGSTGNPKGAMNTHRGIVNRLLWMQETYGLTGQDNVLQKTPYSFDVSVWEFFWPLISGARCVVAPPKSHRDPSELVNLINAHAITTLHFVPSMLNAFLQEPESQTCMSLKRVFCSGEVLVPELQDRFFELFNAELHNLYGPTEAAVDVSYWDCSNSRGTGRVPIGRPVANTQLYVLDQGLRPVPIGVCGDLYIGGVQVGRGYLNNQELTRQCFLDDPFARIFGNKIYKTGDIARFLATGALDFIGRSDYQVKIRGNRIELGEIEKALSQHSLVQECVVVASRENAASLRLVAYIVPFSKEQPSASALRVFLMEKLPDYMIPSVFVCLDAFPHTTSGKIDRKALPKPEQSRQETGVLYSPPSTKAEKRMADLWRQVLGAERIGVSDNFFEIGGDSLSSVQLALLIQKEFGTKVTATHVFQYSTIGSMTKHLESAVDGVLSFDDVKEKSEQRMGAIRRRKKTIHKPSEL
jgi:amino acid adenylation domain-containing protein